MLNESNIPLEEDGIEEEILVDEEVAITKAMWGDVGGNIENQTDLQNALDAKQDSLTEAQLNAVNSGITAEKVTTYDGYADQIASKADQSALNAESTARGEADTALGTRIDNEVLARQQADNGLQSQIDAITSKSNVVDVVANYAALQAYDTSTLGNNDVVKVLDDETHEDALTYYRWSTTTQTWSYIGQEAPYYSKGQMDVKLAEKQDKLTAGANIQIQNGTISATDTTYTAGNGLNLNGTEFSADTDVLATKEDLDDYYTKPETDNLLAPKLEAEVVAELPETGDSSKLYLTPKAHTTSTATGNPIEATITTQAGQLESFQLDGDTFQQTYTGKNLYYDTDGYNQGFLGNNGEISSSANSVTNKTYIEASGNTQYVVSFNPIVGGTGLRGVGCYDSNKDFIRRIPVAEVTDGSFQTAAGTAYIRVYFYNAGGLDTTNFPTNYISDIQLELGSTPTSGYEPYVGGQPSPNPDYPQPIQTVTGTQTISINGTDYTLDLGSIELCKLGTYQDYIYKDGDDWKVHKATKKVELDEQSGWTKNQYGTNAYKVIAQDISTLQTTVCVASQFFTGVSYDGRITTTQNVVFADSQPGIQASDRGISIRNTPWSDTTSLLAWVASNHIIVYYLLLTPTDTTITDQTLIAQLDAIRTASLENGTNTITNTATGTNLAGDMEIGYFGFNPTNRYDKFIWLNLNNNYEQIGGE